MSSVALLACERQSELSWAMERWIPVDESNAEEKKVFVFRLRLHYANCPKTPADSRIKDRDSNSNFKENVEASLKLFDIVTCTFTNAMQCKFLLRLSRTQYASFFQCISSCA
jgi:hypothetical protein